jgi:hypothetical protein
MRTMYESPELTVYGTIQTLTQGEGSGQDDFFINGNPASGADSGCLQQNPGPNGEPGEYLVGDCSGEFISVVQ